MNEPIQKLKECEYEYTDRTGKICKCQFKKPITSDEPIYSCDSKFYCKFHCPMEGKNNTKTIKGQWNKSQITEFNDRINNYILDGAATADVINLRGVVFPGKFELIDLNIESPNVIFSDAQFFGVAIFESIIFKGDTNFDNAIFKNKVEFKEITFSKIASFKDAVFEKLTIFVNTNFWEAHFNGVNFHDELHCLASNFLYNTYFYGAQFGDSVWFNGTNFRWKTVFDNVIFSKNVSFASSFEDTIGEFEGISFSRAEIKGSLSFENRKFNSSTDFSKIIFHKAPEFHNCDLHQDTDFSNAQFLDIKSKYAARAYRTLKLAMGKVRSHYEEGLFYSFEQRSLRNYDSTPIWEKCLSWLYEEISEYGQNSLRPIGYFAGLLYYSFFLYLIFHSAEHSGDPMYSDLASFTIRQSTSPLGIWKESKELCELFFTDSNNLIIRVLATIQSFGSIGLIALTLLAIRWRFRKG